MPKFVVTELKGSKYMIPIKLNWRSTRYETILPNETREIFVSSAEEAELAELLESHAVLGLISYDRYVDRPALQKPRIDIWIKGETGSDVKDGSTEAKAVKTFARAKELLDGVIGVQTKFIVINIRETVDDGEAGSEDVFGFVADPGGRATWSGPTPHIILDGGPDVTVVLDNGSGGEIVSDINAAGQIGLSTAAYEVNQYRGYWLVITSGPMSGKRCLIRENNDTTFILLETGPDYLGDPGVGATFHVERPATVITSAEWSGHNFGAEVLGSHLFAIQRMTVTGGTAPHYTTDSPIAKMMMSRVVFDNPGAFHSFVLQGAFASEISDPYFDTSLEEPELVFNPDERIGIGITPFHFGAALVYFKPNYTVFGSSVIPMLLFYYSSWPVFFNSSVGMLHLMGSNSPSYGDKCGGHTSSYEDDPGVPTRFGGFRFPDLPSEPIWPAVIMESSAADFNLSIMEDSVHGMEICGNSKSVIRGISGTNYGAGVYAHSGAVLWVYPEDGENVSTVTGSVGELTEDGESELSTWQAIGGTRATGTITCVAKASILNGEGFALDAGLGDPAVDFAYQVSGTPPAGDVIIDIQAATTDVEVAQATALAINGAEMGIGAEDPTTATINLSHFERGDLGVLITETVTDAGFTVTGMAGGIDAVPVSDHEVICKEYRVWLGDDWPPWPAE